MKLFMRVMHLILFAFISDVSFASIQSINPMFIQNQGQTDKNIAFYARIPQGNMSITKNAELKLSFLNANKIAGNNKAILITEKLRTNRVLSPSPGMVSSTNVNYFLGQNTKRWYSNLPTYNSVFINHAFSHIDLKLQVRGNNVEKLFIVKPGGNPNAIMIDVDGADIKVLKDGRLALTTKAGTIHFTVPIAFQHVNNKKVPIDVAYRATGNSYGFTVGDYDQSKELIIDPLVQSTYLGGSRSDYINDMVVDPSSSDVYVAGSTFSVIEGGPLLFRQEEDAFIARFSADLKSLLDITYLGGSGTDRIKAISLGHVFEDGAEIYVSGTTNSEDLAGISDTSPQDTLYGNEDAFVAMLPADLSTLNAVSYFGGTILCPDALFTSTDVSTQLFADNGSEDVLFVAGKTGAANLSGRLGPSAQTVCAGGKSDGYITAFSADLSSIIKTTYLGGSGTDKVVGLVHHIGSLFVVGNTNSDDIPGVDSDSAQWDRSEARSENEDVFISRIDEDLSSMTRSTYFGGLGVDTVSSIINKQGSLYFGGNTTSTDLPDISGGLQETANDMYAVRLFSSLETDAFIQVTYLGGSGEDNLQAMTFDDSSSDIFIVGGTKSDDLSGTTDAAQDTLKGASDAFVIRINPFLTPISGGVFQSSYLGGNNSPEEIATTVVTSKIFTPFAVYVAGITTTDSFPQVDEGAQFYRDGGLNDYFEGFVAQLDASLKALPDPIPTPEPEPEGPELDFRIETHDFGSRGVGIQKVWLMNLANIGDEALIISDISFSDTFGVFGIDNSYETLRPCPELPFTISAASICDVPVFYTPNTAEAHSGSLTIFSNDADEASVTVSLTGVGFEGREIDISKTSLDFGNVKRDEGEILALSVSNVGNENLTISSIELINTEQPEDLTMFDLNIEVLSCDLSSAFTLEPGKRCLVSITFRPRESGDFTADLTITSDDEDEAISIIPVTGTGRRRELTDPWCFIATAAFGSNMHQDVKLLRQFRDEVLLTNSVGIKLTEMYYEHSPPIAKFISQHEYLRTMTRVSLYPIIYAIKYPAWMFLALCLSFYLAFFARRRISYVK